MKIETFKTICEQVWTNNIIRAESHGVLDRVTFYGPNKDFPDSFVVVVHYSNPQLDLTAYAKRIDFPNFLFIGGTTKLVDFIDKEMNELKVQACAMYEETYAFWS